MKPKTLQQMTMISQRIPVTDKVPDVYKSMYKIYIEIKSSLIQYGCKSDAAGQD